MKKGSLRITPQGAPGLLSWLNSGHDLRVPDPEFEPGAWNSVSLFLSAPPSKINTNNNLSESHPTMGQQKEYVFKHQINKKQARVIWLPLHILNLEKLRIVVFSEERNCF